jgi:hypothetical protein
MQRHPAPLDDSSSRGGAGSFSKLQGTGYLRACWPISVHGGGGSDGACAWL